MRINEIVKKWVNSDKEKEPRKLGRYWTGDINSILKGYTTPENFFEKGEEIDESGVRMIVSGIASERMLTTIFQDMNVSCKFQEKREIKITEEITLVVKPDYLFEDFLLETKHPFKLFDNIPDRYNFQLEAYYRGFYLPVYLGVFSHPFNVKLMTFIPSKSRWKKICNTLIEFHEKLKKYESDSSKNK